jgi:hypothetical protein
MTDVKINNFSTDPTTYLPWHATMKYRITLHGLATVVGTVMMVGAFFVTSPAVILVLCCGGFFLFDIVNLLLYLFLSNNCIKTKAEALTIFAEKLNGLGRALLADGGVAEAMMTEFDDKLKQKFASDWNATVANPTPELEQFRGHIMCLLKYGNDTIRKATLALLNSLQETNHELANRTARREIYVNGVTDRECLGIGVYDFALDCMEKNIGYISKCPEMLKVVSNIMDACRRENPELASEIYTRAVALLFKETGTDGNKHAPVDMMFSLAITEDARKTVKGVFPVTTAANIKDHEVQGRIALLATTLTNAGGKGAPRWTVDGFTVAHDPAAKYSFLEKYSKKENPTDRKNLLKELNLAKPAPWLYGTLKSQLYVMNDVFEELINEAKNASAFATWCVTPENAPKVKFVLKRGNNTQINKCIKWISRFDNDVKSGLRGKDSAFNPLFLCKLPASTAVLLAKALNYNDDEVKDIQKRTSLIYPSGRADILRSMLGYA